MTAISSALVEDADYRVTVNIGDAHPGDIVTIGETQLADPWMQGQIAAGNLVLLESHAGVTGPVDDFVEDVT